MDLRLCCGKRSSKKLMQKGLKVHLHKFHTNILSKVLLFWSLSTITLEFQNLQQVQDHLGRVDDPDNMENENVTGQDVRLIFHLSYPEKNSINYHTPKELGSVKYKYFDQAIRMCLKAGKGAHMAKSDLKLAFRHLPIRKKDWCWLIMKASDLSTGKVYYFCEKILPFGTRVSCSHFQRVSDAIEWIFKYRTGSRANSYLDDFFFVQEHCNQLVSQFIQMCGDIKFSIAMEKMVWA